MVTFGFTGSGFTSTGFTSPLSSNHTYTIDVAFKKINLVYPFNNTGGFTGTGFTSSGFITNQGSTQYHLDSTFAKINKIKTYLMDVILAVVKKKTYSLDSVFAKHHTGHTYTQDVALKKLNIIYPQPGTGGFTNSGFTNTGFTVFSGYTQYTMDAVFEVAILGAHYILISVFKKLGITHSYTMDSVFSKAGRTKTYLMDTILKKLGFHTNYTLDSIFKKKGRTKTYTMDSNLAKVTITAYTMDAVFVANTFQYVFGDSITMMQPIGTSITQQFVKGTSITQ